MTSTLKLSAAASLLLASVAIGSTSANAGETTHLREISPHFGEDGWDLSLGAGVATYDAPFFIGYDDTGTAAFPLLEATYQKGRFYFAANDTDGLIIAYTLMRSEGDSPWVLDAGFAPVITGMDFTDNDQLEHLGERDVDGLLGLRFTRYGDADRISFSVGKDVLGAHDGYAADVTYFREWQAKNWLLTGSVGGSYVSAKMANHIVGVNAEEATAAFPAYDADAGYSAHMGLKAEYPITENWVFTSGMGTEVLSDTFKDSPITKSDSSQGSYLMAGIKYQF